MVSFSTGLGWIQRGSSLLLAGLAPTIRPVVSPELGHMAVTGQTMKYDYLVVAGRQANRRLGVRGRRLTLDNNMDLSSVDASGVEALPKGSIWKHGNTHNYANIAMLSWTLHL